MTKSTIFQVYNIIFDIGQSILLFIKIRYNAASYALKIHVVLKDLKIHEKPFLLEQTFRHGSPMLVLSHAGLNVILQKLPNQRLL